MIFQRHQKGLLWSKGLNICSTLLNFLNNWVRYSFFIHLGIANVNLVFNISNKYLFGYFGFSIWYFCNVKTLLTNWYILCLIAALK